jgi:hypothetical protein
MTAVADLNLIKELQDTLIEFLSFIIFVIII